MAEPPSLDDLDKRLLAALAADSYVSTTALAERLGAARSTVQTRIERMRANGTIAGFTIRLGPAQRRRQVRATVLLAVEPRAAPGVLQRLRPIPEVETCLTTTGRIDLILQIVVDDLEALDTLLDKIGRIPGVADTESLVHLSTKFDRRAL